MFQSKFLVLLAGIALLPCCALAQKNEISFSAGAAFGDDQSLAVGDPSQCSFSRPHCQFFELLSTPGKLALEGSFAHRLFAAGPVSLYAEVPVSAVPHHKVNAEPESVFAFAPPLTLDGSALFFTPGVKVKVSLPMIPVAPWASAGGGLAHITLDPDPRFSATVTSRNTGALELGGGLDFKTPLPHLGFRAEYRNFRSGTVFTTDNSRFFFVSPERIHHTFGAVGVVLMF